MSAEQPKARASSADRGPAPEVRPHYDEPMRSMAGLVVAALNSTPPPSHKSGVQLLAIFGLVGTIIGITAAIQQFTSAIKRRKFRRAEDAFMAAVQANRDISAVKEEFDNLRRQIKNQIPQQAREAYLGERLDQLEHDLYNTYLEYQRVVAELPNRRMDSDLDRRLREVVETSVAPRHRAQERRNIVAFGLLLLLLFVNLGPINLHSFVYNYFNSLGYSDQWTTEGLVINFALGVLIILTLALISTALLPGDISVGKMTGLLSRIATPLLTLLLAFGLFAAGMLIRASVIRVDNSNSSTYVDVTARETYAGVSFNLAAIALAIALASLILIARRSIRRRLDLPSPQG